MQQRLITTSPNHKPDLTHSNSYELCEVKPEENILFQVLAIREPMAVERLQASITAEAALSQPHQISAIRKQHPEQCQTTIVMLVTKLLQAFPGKNNLPASVIAMASMLIEDEFWFMRPEEVMFAFKQAITGAYKPTYGQIDVQTILGWLREYDQKDRMATLERLRMEESRKHRQEAEAQAVALKPLYPSEGRMPFVLQQSQERREKERTQHRQEVEFQKYEQQYWSARQQDNQSQSNPS